MEYEVGIYEGDIFLSHEWFTCLGFAKTYAKKHRQSYINNTGKEPVIRKNGVVV